MAFELKDYIHMLCKGVIFTFAGRDREYLCEKLGESHFSEYSQCDLDNQSYYCLHNPRECKGALFRCVKRFLIVLNQIIENTPLGSTLYFEVKKEIVGSANPLYLAMDSLGYSLQEIFDFQASYHMEFTVNV